MAWKKTLGRLFLAATIFVGAGISGAQAMEISKFDQMSESDQGRYVGTILSGAAGILWDQGNKLDAAKISGLLKKDQNSRGVSKLVLQFNGILERMRHMKTDKPLHVEHAMFVTLKHHGIILPMNEFMQVAKDFQPEDNKFVERVAPKNVTSLRTGQSVPGE